MGIAMMVDSSVETLPMQRFIQDLVRDSSNKKETSFIENSAKCVLDFDLMIANNIDATNKGNTSDTDGSGHSLEKDTFDINSLVLVSDNARVFANARPKPNKAPLTSASWHSSSELRKMHTAKTRWGGTPESSQSLMRNQTFSLHNNDSNNSKNNNTITASDKRSILRRTSDSCLSVPTRSWMKPQHREQSSQASHQQSKQPSNRRSSDSCLSIPTRGWMKEQASPSQSQQQSIRTRRTGLPIPPSRSQAPPRPSTVASRFSASPLEAALEARRSWHARPCTSSSDEMSMRSSDSFYSSDSVRSFEDDDDDDDDLLDRAQKVINSPPAKGGIAALDSRQLISCSKTAEAKANGGWNSRWSPPTQVERKSQRRSSRSSGYAVATKGLQHNNNNTSSSNNNLKQRPLAPPPQRFAPIPPSLLLPYDRFQADAPKADSSDSLSSMGSASGRNPRLSRSRSSKSSGSKLSTQRRGSGGSRNSLRNAASSSRNSLFGASSSASSRNSLFGKGSNNLGSINNLGSKSYHNRYSNSSIHSAHEDDRLRSHSDHYSPVSTLELALGDMAPKRKGRRKAVGRAKSNETY